MLSIKNIGLGHYSHPFLYQAFVDTNTGREGILVAIAPNLMDDDHTHRRKDPERPVIDHIKPVAWLRPYGGGREWSTALSCLERP